MSKFTDRLRRLHSSRVRALSEGESDDHNRVFHADSVEETPAAPSERSPSEPNRESKTTDEPERTPARDAVRAQLRRGERLKSGGPRRLKMKRAKHSAPDPEPNEPRTDRGSPKRGGGANAVGERLAELRLRAEALVEVGALDAALPMLHEMLALSPSNPYPLDLLTRYWRSQGDETLARLYEARLKNAAPY